MQTDVLFGLTLWDLLLFAAAGYVALISLVRLMRLYRDETTDRLRREVLEAQLKQAREEQSRLSAEQQAA